MPVLVTGGTGFIGSRLVPHLAAAGAQVTVLSRDPARAGRQFGAGIHCVKDPSETKERPPRVVVNLAGAGIADWPWTSRRRVELLDSRIAYTDRLRASLIDTPPEILVSASAVGYYGVSESREFTEKDGPGEGFAAQLCRRWEASAEAFSALGTRVTCVRIGLVLGPGGLLGRMKLPFSLGLGGRLGHGRQWMSWVHLDDVVGIFERSITDPELAGAVNATAPASVTNAEFTRTLGQVLKRPTPFPVPAFLLHSLLGQMADELLLAGAYVRPERAQAAAYPFRYPALEDALRDALGRTDTGG
ncbi:MAG: TIGR01777 family protein [Gammaproteobacteria bacterium]|nr:MAG: TIGR01777 family protein [Gammaproteobacteria bacterium]